MRAVVISQFGPPEVLRVEERPPPEPSRGEVRVRVRATAVNRADLLQRAGRYPPPPGVPVDVPGLEFAGEIETLGPDTEGWKVGDRVFGLVAGGAYAENVIVHGRTLARIPDRLTFIEAAAVPEAFITAYDAMVDQARLSAGETVLISAVGSGVGTAAVQLARALGARALGTSRTGDKLERARALGLAQGILAQEGTFAREVLEATNGGGVDVILELVGANYLAEDLACIAPRGRLVVVGLVGGAKAQVDLGVVLSKRLELRGTTLRARPLEEKIAAAQSFARHVVPLLELGVVAPVVDRVLPLASAVEAHRYVSANEGFGKVVLDCG
jgi:putative PIG3 family NAD(P)H quinone oxidoreductase